MFVIVIDEIGAVVFVVLAVLFVVVICFSGQTQFSGATDFHVYSCLQSSLNYYRQN